MKSKSAFKLLVMAHIIYSILLILWIKTLWIFIISLSLIILINIKVYLIILKNSEVLK